MSGVDLYVNENRILEPLNLVVLEDSRIDLLPSVKLITEEIPGRHGDIFFGSKYLPRLLELRVAVDQEFSFEERETKKREIAGYLNPTKGAKVLVFADDPERQYFVKFTGSIDVTVRPSWFEFTIPFKCSDPYLYSAEKEEEGLAETSPLSMDVVVAGSQDSLPVLMLENEGVNTISGFKIRRFFEIEV